MKNNNTRRIQLYTPNNNTRAHEVWILQDIGKLGNGLFGPIRLAERRLLIKQLQLQSVVFGVSRSVLAYPGSGEKNRAQLGHAQAMFVFKSCPVWPWGLYRRVSMLPR